MSAVADSIRRGLLQAVTYAAGEADTTEYRVNMPDHIDVKAIRGRMGLTQEAFANQFGFSVSTLRHWENGSRRPESAARAYLTVIERAPGAVRAALRAT